MFQKNGFDFVEGADGRLALSAVPLSQKVWLRPWRSAACTQSAGQLRLARLRNSMSHGCEAECCTRIWKSDADIDRSISLPLEHASLTGGGPTRFAS